MFFVFGLPSEHTMIEAKLQTATIDDEYGDSVTGAKPTFLPGAGGFWQGSECDSSCGYPECQGCGLSIDPKRAYKGTWHVATHRVEDPTDLVQIEFIGTEVSAFCIVPDPQGNITTQYELTFLLDGIPAGGIWTGPDGTPVTETQYSVRCFHQSALDNKKHTLILRAESMRFDTVFLFDYATYVYDDEQTDDITPAGPSPTASPSESSTSTQIPSITNLSPPATSSSIPPPASPLRTAFVFSFPSISTLLVFALLSEHSMVEEKLQTADDEDSDSVTSRNQPSLPVGGLGRESKCDASCDYLSAKAVGLTLIESAQTEFVGIEVNVFCIVPGPRGNIIQYELTYLLDGYARRHLDWPRHNSVH
uniref:Uncharacterized protein n=1 Tax=Moniliophthora roreri TaxID=221103 RepID=A0A0W0FZ88_MONRR